MDKFYLVFRVACIVLYAEIILAIAVPDTWISITKTYLGFSLITASLTYIIIYLNFSRISIKHDYTSIFKQNVDEGSRLKLIKYTDADPNTIFKDGESMLMKAVALEDIELVKYLVLKGADIDYRNNLGFNSLEYAVDSGNLDITKFLIDSGCVPDCKTMEYAYNSPIGLNPHMVKLLKENGVDDNC